MADRMLSLTQYFIVLVVILLMRTHIVRGAQPEHPNTPFENRPDQNPATNLPHGYQPSTATPPPAMGGYSGQVTAGDPGNQDYRQQMERGQMGHTQGSAQNMYNGYPNGPANNGNPVPGSPVYGQQSGQFGGPQQQPQYYQNGPPINNGGGLQPQYQPAFPSPHLSQQSQPPVGYNAPVNDGSPQFFRMCFEVQENAHLQANQYSVLHQQNAVQTNYPQYQIPGFDNVVINKYIAFYKPVGTVVEAQDVNSETDAVDLYEAMKGSGTNNDVVIRVLGYRTSLQRQNIVSSFTLKYMEKKPPNNDLVDSLNHEKRISGDYKKVIQGMMMLIHDYLAQELHIAFEKLIKNKTNHDKYEKYALVVIQILCTRPQKEIHFIIEAYNTKFNLLTDIKAGTDGQFNKLLIAIITADANWVRQVEADRLSDPYFYCDQNNAFIAAQALSDASRLEAGRYEETFINILMNNDFVQLNNILIRYRLPNFANTAIELTIQKKFSGHVRDGLLAKVKCAQNRPEYFANKFHDATKGMQSVDQEWLIRFVLSFCENDLQNIIDAYNRLFKSENFAKVVEAKTTLTYETIMLTLIGAKKNNPKVASEGLQPKSKLRGFLSKHS